MNARTARASLAATPTEGWCQPLPLSPHLAAQEARRVADQLSRYVSPETTWAALKAAAESAAQPLRVAS